MANCRRQKNALYFIRSQQIIIRIFRRAALKKIARNFHGAQFLIKKLFGHNFRRVSHSFRRAQWRRFLILRAINPMPRLGPQNIPTRAEHRSRRPRQSENENSAPEGARARTRTRSRAKRIQRRARAMPSDMGRTWKLKTGGILKIGGIFGNVNTCQNIGPEVLRRANANPAQPYPCKRSTASPRGTTINPSQAPAQNPLLICAITK